MAATYRRTLAVVAVAAVLPLLVLTVVVARYLPDVPSLDAAWHASTRAYSVAHPDYLAVMRAVTRLGDGVTLWLVDTAVFVVCLVRQRPRAAAFVVVAGLGTWAVSFLIRIGLGRARPGDALWTATNYAFPSGHSTGSAAAATIVTVLCWPALHRRASRVAALVAAVTVPAAVAFSRVAGGVHWPTDAAGGLLLGVAGVTAAAAATTPWHPEGLTRYATGDRRLPRSRPTPS